MAATRRAKRRVDRRTSPAADGNARAALLRAAGEVFAERGYPDASVDEIAARAGYSKGALYWHFASKDDLFLALVEERIDAPTREMIALLESAPPEQDMAPVGSRRLAELLNGQRELLLLDHEYWLQAVRAPSLRVRYAQRRADLRAALGRALEARLQHLGGPLLGPAAEDMATVVMGLAAGLAQQKLIQPDAVRDDLFGEAIVLIYRGLLAGG
jgi:AcrR family transcriptional regulator